MHPSPPTFFEFFAGGGMARLGLGPAWHCGFANDISEKKASSYRAFFGNCPELLVRDVAELSAAELPGAPTLVWASFPCQDLSLAGSGAGLNGRRSGTFKPFWALIQTLVAKGRIPKLVVLENVIGALTSHGGRDFETLVRSLTGEGYKVGCLVMDAVRFLPQSRQRLFVIGAHSTMDIDAIAAELKAPGPTAPWHTASLRNAYSALPKSLQAEWVWWNVPVPDRPVAPFGSLIEDEPTGVRWHTSAETERLIGLMSPLHKKKLEAAMRSRQRLVGTLYKRARPNEQGVNVQRAEVRFDQVSGCLRTPAGGSSRQTILVVEGKRVRSRLLSPREAARLMGVPDFYPLPSDYNDAYHIFGDGLAVPVVSWLNQYLLLPLAASQRIGKAVSGARTAGAAWRS